MKTVLAFLAMAAVAAAQGRYIDSGSSITVRTNETIDARSSDGRVFTGVVDREVADRNGNVVIPRGAQAEMIVRNVSGNELALDLESISANGQRFAVSGEADRAVSGDRRDGLGTNKRTGEYVGGGALLGVIVGAIAGGGKGAAIGAAAGAAAGAGAQVLTRGRTLNIPAESLLTFRLDRPLQMGVADNGYDRGGQHYHNGYPAGYAGNGGGAGLITCGSNNRGRVHCNADTSGGVRLSRQLSAATCREGSTWGYDSQGVWVDRGCRAEFQLSGNGGYAGNPNGDRYGGDRYNRPTTTANLVSCSSENQQRAHCDADTRGGVRMVRQLSSATCQEGSTWGFDSQGIWVDRGCRAEFELSGNGSGYRSADRYGRSNGGNGGPNTITCSSDNGQRVNCGVDTRNGVRMLRQLSDARCDEGSTWGYDARGVWVDRGCRAEFEVR